jgi:hypothetical protein
VEVTFHDLELEWILRPIRHYSLQQKVREEIMLKE